MWNAAPMIIIKSLRIKTASTKIGIWEFIHKIKIVPIKSTLSGTIFILWMNSHIPIFVLAVFILRDFIIIMGAAFHMTVYETAAPNPNIFGKITTFVHIGYLAGVFVDIIFSLNLINFMVDCLVSLVTLISLFLYSSNWFKLTAKMHRE